MLCTFNIAITDILNIFKYIYIYLFQIPAYKKLFSEMQYVPEKDMLSTVSTGGYGFISWKTYMRYMVAKKKADPSWRTDVSSVVYDN